MKGMCLLGGRTCACNHAVAGVWRARLDDKGAVPSRAVVVVVVVVVGVALLLVVLVLILLLLLLLVLLIAAAASSSAKGREEGPGLLDVLDDLRDELTGDGGHLVLAPDLEAEVGPLEAAAPGHPVALARQAEAARVRVLVLLRLLGPTHARGARVVRVAGRDAHGLGLARVRVRRVRRRLRVVGVEAQTSLAARLRVAAAPAVRSGTPPVPPARRPPKDEEHDQRPADRHRDRDRRSLGEDQREDG
jgi:hypothetical protein